MEGKYEVTRTSSPIYNTEVKVDSVYLSFKENIVIDKKTTSINLSAQYNSYMLIFDTNNTKSIEYNYGTYDESEGYHIKLPKSNNIYYMFVKNLLNEGNPAANRITYLNVNYWFVRQPYLFV